MWKGRGRLRLTSFPSLLHSFMVEESAILQIDSLLYFCILIKMRIVVFKRICLNCFCCCFNGVILYVRSFVTFSFVRILSSSLFLFSGFLSHCLIVSLSIPWIVHLCTPYSRGLSRPLHCPRLPQCVPHGHGDAISQAQSFDFSLKTENL